MKAKTKLLLIFLTLTLVLSGCAASAVVRQSVEESGKEFAKWQVSFTSRMNTMPDQDVGPFSVWIIAIIGEDKIRLPREAENLIGTVQTIVKAKEDGEAYTRMERAELMGCWDRLFIILSQEAGKKGVEIVKKLMSAGIL